MNAEIINIKTIEKFVGKASLYYEGKAAACVEEYLYQTLEKISEGKIEQILLLEILHIQKLEEDGIWLNPEAAKNLVLKILDRCGKDTSHIY